jgi:UDP:flavonoid glycosyltransferase YjiC (YdhE family)
MTSKAYRKFADRLILYGYSPSLLPKPFDWDARKHVTGYWFLDIKTEWQPSPSLVDFIESGSPPVYVGYGSMKNRNPEETLSLVIGALKRARQRGIYFTGKDDVRTEKVIDNIFFAKSIPHDWLFPRMAAVVHHGGAGTTAGGLRAGVPSVITPFFADQPFWAHLVYKRGAGTKPILRKNLTVENLADSITKAVTDVDIRKRAAALGECIRTEDGVGNAVKIISQSLTMNS